MYIIQFLLLCSMICGYSQFHVKRFDGTNGIANTSNTITTQVLIIGAGISGLEAARLLGKNGIQTLVLEARNRTGGRIWSVRSKYGHIFDMGASYIHGINGSIPSGFLTNPLWDLVQEAKISTHRKRNKDFLGSYPANNNSISNVQNWYNEYMTFVREETRILSTNFSFGYYANLFANQQNFTEEQQEAFINYVYFSLGNTEGAELDTINAKIYSDINSFYYGDEHIFDETGYTALIDYLSRDVKDIRLEQVVKTINYTDKLVTVTTNDGHIYRAEFVLLTVPLGVLKSQQIEFIPQLPQWKLNAIDRIGFGVYEKIFLYWDQPWWNFTDFYFFHTASAPNELRYSLSSNKWNNKPAITCVFSGDAGRLKLNFSQDQVLEEILNTLQTIFPDIVIPPFSGSYITNWNQDPFSFGSYSYISTKQMYEDPFYLGEPISSRLLFAGEATSTDTYGYTHGALLSARREVTRLLFVYDLLSQQTTTTSRSPGLIPLNLLIIINFISLC